tara:strand:- start:2534 stop:4822 length:2289 start_codon:yes stop_codon:yes gene_type:complete
MAIAFYDSGRLLPYRHKNLSEQIQQRNADAERTRQYIGYAGGAFANMAERTGQIFGADLYSGYKGQQPQEAGAQQAGLKLKTDQQPQEYFGGTIGRDMRKAGWQKDITDQENQRREVTHKLGLHMKAVEMGNIQQNGKAWGWRDRNKIEKTWNKIYDAYIADTQQLSKYELVVKYKNLFPKNTQRLLEDYANYKGDDIEQRRKEIIEELTTNPQHTATTDFMKWAEDAGYYNPDVYTEPRDDVNNMVAYVKNQLGYTINTPEKKPAGLVKTGIHEFNEQLLEEKYKKKKQIDSGSETIPKFEPQPLHKGPISLLKPVQPTNEVLAADQDEVEKQAAADLKEGKDIIDIPIPTVDKNGQELSFDNKLSGYIQRLRASLAARIRAGAPLIGIESSGRGAEFDPTKQTILNKITAELVEDGELSDDTKAQIETTTESIVNNLKREEEVLRLKYGPTINTAIEKIEKKLGAEEPGFRVDVTPSTVIKKDLSAVPKSIYSDEYDEQVANNLLYNEGFKVEADGLAHVVDDLDDPAIGPSVNAWEMAQGDANHKTKIMNQVRKELNLKPESPKWKALEKYFLAPDLHEFLGHVKRGESPIDVLTPAQQANRDSLKLTPEEGKALGMWAYDKNLKILTNNHEFLKPSVYRKYPELKQLLGDMAYRHGGSFMTDRNKELGFTSFRDYISHLVGTETELGNQERNPRGILLKAEFELFNKGLYATETSPRKSFLQNRFEQFWAAVMTQDKYSGKSRRPSGKGRYGSRKRRN